MMRNREIADTFATVADMLAIRGDQIHRVLAYRRAAESISDLGRDIHQVYEAGALTEIPGIGKTLADKIEEMLTTGKLEFFERLAQEVPPTLVEMLRVEGLGPKRVKQIYDSLGITTLDELTAAAQTGKLRDLPGLGAKSEAKLVAAIEALSRHGDGRTPLGDAWPLAREILAVLAQLPGVSQTAVGGSLRRMRETIGDIDLLVAAAESAHIMDTFVKLPQVESISGHGPTKSSVVLLNGVQVDLRVLPAERWGTLLSYFTGSKNHNVRLRELALKQGLSLNEHAFTPEDGRPEILCPTEEDVYATLGLPYILPTLREDTGEIEAAQNGRLPQVVQLADIISDLHMHTTWSDGKLSVMEMAQIAKAQGLRYIVITDHSVSLGIANGLSVERLRAQAAEVRAADEALGPDFRVLHGTEMEIKADGSLDYPDEVLAELDFVIASLHTSLSQPREQVMARLLNALRNPHVDMIAHPTGRLLPDRAGADLDMDVVLETAVSTRTILEINANPERLDLRDSHVRRAIALGAKIAINTDAHHPDQFAFRHFGVAVAQRGWATAESIVNTWPVEQFLAFVQREKFA
ncbi:MAG: DNA polymerase/3'-5' exonuclease PolX [Chloroflexi bacterium]|nr:DNA polymerase/3'-5' exonuclease PolX [Chloroflexota bacterium]MBK6713362.1 DNA polymerase/3'-5' exonuclease PolX [Chloroflexota bacterium]MBK7176982.1 DNA polymerase/3'-5' exonuclease PolX [Chloroflexota bacterium]MBP7590184.1 DNA polymerase/3'-5' exonuclease PolX [Chloroflexota bacterium]